jgi:hypothetical protein
MAAAGPETWRRTASLILSSSKEPNALPLVLAGLRTHAQGET